MLVPRFSSAGCRNDWSASVSLALSRTKRSNRDGCAPLISLYLLERKRLPRTPPELKKQPGRLRPTHFTVPTGAQASRLHSPELKKQPGRCTPLISLYLTGAQASRLHSPELNKQPGRLRPTHFTFLLERKRLACTLPN